MSQGYDTAIEPNSTFPVDGPQKLRELFQDLESL